VGSDVLSVLIGMCLFSLYAWLSIDWFMSVFSVCLA
jgi:hypothetical protein